MLKNMLKWRTTMRIKELCQGQSVVDHPTSIFIYGHDREKAMQSTIIRKQTQNCNSSSTASKLLNPLEIIKVCPALAITITSPPTKRTSGGKEVAAVTSATRIRFALGGTIYNAWVPGKEVGIYILIEKKIHSKLITLLVKSSALREEVPGLRLSSGRWI
ncbi:hypothetical protein F2Q70_00023818 [Brassica cretica]|uniref:Uncharacterized protein n=1 Tax=Brassica cretica TaxID=69181 RepID=A0A8S9GIM4_BRACR|nr:hypothetical protein F2Q70_00023818 [Brassica cretica]